MSDHSTTAAGRPRAQSTRDRFTAACCRVVGSWRRRWPRIDRSNGCERLQHREPATASRVRWSQWSRPISGRCGNAFVAAAWPGPFQRVSPWLPPASSWRPWYTRPARSNSGRRACSSTGAMTFTPANYGDSFPADSSPRAGCNIYGRCSSRWSFSPSSRYRSDGPSSWRAWRRATSCQRSRWHFWRQW